MGGMYWSTAQLWSWDDAPCAGELSAGRLCPRKGKICLLMVTELISVVRESGEHHSSGQRGQDCITEQHLENCP